MTQGIDAGKYVITINEILNNDITYTKDELDVVQLVMVLRNDHISYVYYICHVYFYFSFEHFILYSRLILFSRQRQS